MDVNSLKVLFTSLSGRYAHALFNEGERKSCLDEIFRDFSKLKVFFNNNQTIKKLLTSHAINKKDSDKGWIAIGEHLSFCPIFLGFIRQVILNRRFDLIGKIEHIYNVAFAKYKNKRNVMVSSAVELLPEQKVRIEKLVTKAFKEKAIINYKINKKILGGIKVSSEEVQVDISAFMKLKQLYKYYKDLQMKVPLYED